MRSSLWQVFPVHPAVCRTAPLVNREAPRLSHFISALNGERQHFSDIKSNNRSFWCVKTAAFPGCCTSFFI
jgi:hypothetical protein